MIKHHADLIYFQLDILDTFPTIKIAVGYKDPETGEVNETLEK